MKIRTQNWLLSEMRAAAIETASRPGSARPVIKDVAFFSALAAVGAGMIYFGVFPNGAGESAGAITILAAGTVGSLLCLRRLVRAVRLSPLPWATEQEAVEFYRAQLATNARASAAG